MIGEVLLTTLSGHFRLLQCDQILLELGDIVVRRNASTGQQVLKGQPGHVRQRSGPRQRQTVLLEEKNRQLALDLRRSQVGGMDNFVRSVMATRIGQLPSTVTRSPMLYSSAPDCTAIRVSQTPISGKAALTA